MQDNFYGLVLGKNQCKLPKEHASVAIDVDLSHYDIRPIHCPKPICNVTGDCLTYVSDTCCKTDYWSECDPLGIIAVENGELWIADDECSEHRTLCVPTPDVVFPNNTPDCECDYTTSFVMSNITSDGLEGPLGSASGPSKSYDNEINLNDFGNVVLYASQGNGWFCQGRTDQNGGFVDFSELSIGPPPISEGWCECPSNVKFLERHRSGSLMTTSGKNIYISHPSQPQLWGKYDIAHCREIVSMMGINGDVFVFDGQSAFIIQGDSSNGYILSEFDDNVCIDSPKQLTKYNGAIFLMTNDGPRSISGSQYNRSIFGYLNSNFINPSYFCGDNDWSIGVHGTKVHFSNGVSAYIYDLLTEQSYALTESSLVPVGYHSNCDGIYYQMADGSVMEWNPCDTDYCSYTYCTSTDKGEECKNYGVMEINGSEFGNQRTQITVSYVDPCCNEIEVCDIQVKFCKTMGITGCSNTHGVKTCYTGTDIIFMHNYATAPAEMR